MIQFRIKLLILVYVIFLTTSFGQNEWTYINNKLEQDVPLNRKDFEDLDSLVSIDSINIFQFRKIAKSVVSNLNVLGYNFILDYGELFYFINLDVNIGDVLEGRETRNHVLYKILSNVSHPQELNSLSEYVLNSNFLDRELSEFQFKLLKELLRSLPYHRKIEYYKAKLRQDKINLLLQSSFENISKKKDHIKD